MATTNSILVAGKTLVGQGSNGNNGRYGLKAKVAAGAAILGCTAALALGGLRSGDNAQAPPAQAAQSASNPYWVFTEDVALNGNPALAYSSAAPMSIEWLYFLEQNLYLPGGAAAPLDWEQEERTQVAPPAPAPPCPMVGTTPDGC